MSGDPAEPMPDYDDFEDDLCQRCGGEGWYMASDGDPSEWGEDTYCGPEDATLTCRECRGTGYIGCPSTTAVKK